MLGTWLSNVMLFYQLAQNGPVPSLAAYHWWDDPQSHKSYIFSVNTGPLDKMKQTLSPIFFLLKIILEFIFRIIVGLKESWGWDAITCWRLVKNGVYYNPPLTQSRRKKNEATCFGWSLTLSWWWEKYRQHSSECSVRCSAHCTKMQDKKTAEIWWNFIPNCI